MAYRQDVSFRELRMQSPPVRLHWCGFEATSYQMQQAGWLFEKYRDNLTFCDVVAFKHPKNSVIGRFKIDDVWDKYNNYKPEYYHIGIPVEVQLAKDIIVDPRVMTIDDYSQPLDMLPSYMEPGISIHKTNLFKCAIAPEKNRIILPKELNVDEMLAAILEKQQPAQVEYFNNKVRENKMPEARMSAQIIQLVA